ncbi:BCCT family transporter [Arthrobacter sedimenti]|uniref:BCCT family transporter n=1 Tax=Arthrobacter sedimenti TaxID=2694931 RepID=UPI000B3558ED|nr:BCCT family transporter [Arthrobacter sedimenti]OUM43343.1 choline transporter [Arthrobacter agilis]
MSNSIEPIQGSPPGEETPFEAPPGEAPVKAALDKPVLFVSLSIVILLMLVAVLFPTAFSDITTSVLNGLVATFGWAFVATATGFVVFALFLAFSKYGRIPLGKDGEKPEYSRVSWIAMMFSAGMGIGLMFYGVTEPISHYLTPPVDGIEPGTPEAARQAMNYTLFHWAIHPWAIYAVVGLALAYSAFRRDRGAGFSGAFTALFRGRPTPKGLRAIDVFAIFATLFGSATSLGLGVLQINGGLSKVFGVGSSLGLQIALIAVLTVCFVLSAVSGISRGIKWLSNGNMILALALLFFLFVVGPTVFILELIPASTGSYLISLPQMASRTGAFGGHEWLAAWTIFYWAWWVSWTPFVGSFLAKISRGRTIREFVLGVVAVPSVISVLWFSVWGGSALTLQDNGVDIAAANAESQESAMFALLSQYPLASVTSILVVVLVAVFFISGADASSIVLGSLSSFGSAVPRKWLTILWGALTGGVAAVLLSVGSLEALQTLTIIAAAPFLLVMIGLCVALMMDLAKDPLITGTRRTGSRAARRVPQAKS